MGLQHEFFGVVTAKTRLIKPYVFYQIAPDHPTLVRGGERRVGCSLVWLQLQLRSGVERPAAGQDNGAGRRVAARAHLQPRRMCGGRRRSGTGSYGMHWGCKRRTGHGQMAAGMGGCPRDAASVVEGRVWGLRRRACDGGQRRICMWPPESRTCAVRLCAATLRSSVMSGRSVLELEIALPCSIVMHDPDGAIVRRQRC